MQKLSIIRCVNCGIPVDEGIVFCDKCNVIDTDDKERSMFERVYGVSVEKLKTDADYRKQFLKQWEAWDFGIKEKLKNIRLKPLRKKENTSFFADYEDLPTRHKQLVDAMCKDKQVLCFLSLCIAKEVYEGGFKTKQEVEDLFNEIFPEKTEEEIRARMHEEWLKEKGLL